jgi:2-dehydropantoate 2-reductase
MLRHAGIVCKVTDQLTRARWEKLVWNIPFNGLGVASAAGYEALTIPSSTFRVPSLPGPCLSSGELLDGGKWESLVREVMLETIAAANALGHSLEVSLAEKMIERTRPLGAYKASTILDFEMGRPLELGSLFLEPLRQARSTGVSAPRLSRLCAVLQQLDAARATDSDGR